MDDLDKALIMALRRDGRASISELAHILGITRATVRNRMERLTASGEIAGFSVVLRADQVLQPVRGVTLIAIEGRGTSRIISQLNRMPEVTAIHTTSGKWDLIIELGTNSLPELDAILAKIRMIDGVSASETNLYLSTKRASGVPHLPDTA